MKSRFFRWISLAVAVVLIAGIGGWILLSSLEAPREPSKGDATGRKILYYKSTMMVGEISQTPRKDSMGAEMVPVYEGETDSAQIRIDPATTQNMGIRTAQIVRGPVHRVIRTVGKIDFDETAVSDVTTRVEGWIEQLYVNSTGKLVHKGEPLFEFYSAELYLGEKEYLLAQADGKDAGKYALNKLFHLGLSTDQIENLQKTQQVPHTLRIVSPRDGVVMEKNALQGTMTEPGKVLYRIGDLGTVWALADIYEQDLPYIQVGQQALVKLSYMPDRSFRGTVTYIYPTVDEKTRTARIRMVFPNPGFFLKPGMFATVEIHSVLAPDAVLVPDMAVLRSGEKNTVFIARKEGRFEPRQVVLGARSMDGNYQVLSGLSEGEIVVTSGQFLLDSESQLREAAQKMLSPNPTPDDSTSGNAPSASDQSMPTGDMSGMQMPQAQEQKTTTLRTAYVCPMPEHLSILYDAPGKCPICGMTLVETTVSSPSSSPTPSPNSPAGHAQGNH